MAAKLQVITSTIYHQWNFFVLFFVRKFKFCFMSSYEEWNNIGFMDIWLPRSNRLTVNPTIAYLTHLRLDKIVPISRTTSNAFSLMKRFGFGFGFRWSLFLKVQLTIIQHWFRKMLGAKQATSHYLNQCFSVHWRIYAALGGDELISTNSRIFRPHWTIMLFFAKHLERNSAVKFPNCIL